jgi:hypothetical protein
MFDEAACCRTVQVAVPAVACHALREVRALIDLARQIPSIPVIQAEHPILAERGAHANQEPTAPERSAAVVRAECAPAVEGVTTGGACSHGGSPRAPAAPARTRARHSGGAR